MDGNTTRCFSWSSGLIVYFLRKSNATQLHHTNPQTRTKGKTSSAEMYALIVVFQAHDSLVPHNVIFFRYQSVRYDSSVGKFLHQFLHNRAKAQSRVALHRKQGAAQICGRYSQLLLLTLSSRGCRILHPLSEVSVLEISLLTHRTRTRCP